MKQWLHDNLDCPFTFRRCCDGIYYKLKVGLSDCCAFVFMSVSDVIRFCIFILVWTYVRRWKRTKEKISMAPFASTTKVNTSFRGWGIKHEDVHGWVLNDLWTWRLQEKHEESHEEPSSVASRGPGGLFILVGLNLFHVDAIEASNNSFVCRVECQIIDNKYISYVSLVFKWSMCRPNLSDLKNS